MQVPPPALAVTSRQFASPSTTRHGKSFVDSSPLRRETGINFTSSRASTVRSMVKVAMCLHVRQGLKQAALFASPSDSSQNLEQQLLEGTRAFGQADRRLHGFELRSDFFRRPIARAAEEPSVSLSRLMR